MMWLLYILAYLAVGTVAARIAFVRVLGDADRYCKDRLYAGYHTNEYNNAIIASLVLQFGWALAIPVFGTAYFITKDTGHEKRVAKQAELKELESEMKRLEKEYNLDFRK